MTDPDTKVLEATIRVLSRALDDLIGECMDDKGKPCAPDRAALMRARALLPGYCRHAFKRDAAR